MYGELVERNARRLEWLCVCVCLFVVSARLPVRLLISVVARDTGMNVKQLEILVESFWKRTGGPFCATDLMMMTLQTNPCFHDHDRDPTLWELSAQSLNSKVPR